MFFIVEYGRGQAVRGAYIDCQEGIRHRAHVTGYFLLEQTHGQVIQQKEAGEKDMLVEKAKRFQFSFEFSPFGFCKTSSLVRRPFAYDAARNPVSFTCRVQETSSWIEKWRIQ